MRIKLLLLAILCGCTPVQEIPTKLLHVTATGKSILCSCVEQKKEHYILIKNKEWNFFGGREYTQEKRVETCQGENCYTRTLCTRHQCQ